MAEAYRLPGDKLTVGAQPCVNHNSAIKNLSGDVPERLSGSGGTENNFVAARAVGGHQIMACSNLPGRESADILKAEGQGDPARRDDTYPSSLRSSSSCTSSYSLEISLSASDRNNNESQPLPLQTPPGSKDSHTIQTNFPISQVPFSGGRNASVTHSYKPFTPKPLEKREQPADSTSACINQCLNSDSCQIVTSKSTNQEHSLEKNFSSLPGSSGKIGAQPVSPGQPCKASLTHDAGLVGGLSTEEEQFYAFVILHAPEDTDEAVRIQARLETVLPIKGATFAEDFAEPGCSIFQCVEDAIDNSAFVMLLLTPNFNTHLNETNTDSALMNSIEKPHKYNTVIPLLPRTNALTKDKFPLVLRTKVSLDERNQNFEMMAKRSLAVKKIETQKAMWKQELRVKKLQENQQRLREENRHHRNVIRENKKLCDLEQEKRQLFMQQPRLPGPYPPQPPSDQAYYLGGQAHDPRPYQLPCPTPPCHSEPPSNINIQNAQYIIIGNDSTMTVGCAGNSSGDEVFNA